jgi:hypothetical protein
MPVALLKGAYSLLIVACELFGLFYEINHPKLTIEYEGLKVFSKGAVYVFHVAVDEKYADRLLSIGVPHGAHLSLNYGVFFVIVVDIEVRCPFQRAEFVNHPALESDVPVP